MSKLVCQFLFGRFLTQNKPPFGRPSQVEDDNVKALVESNQHVTERWIGEKLSTPKLTVHNHI